MQKKSLLERLAESATASEAHESTKRLAAFLKHWEEIDEAYREGWSYKEIWRVMHRDGLIDFGYSSFLNFARKLRRRQMEFEAERNRKANNAAAAAAVVKGGAAAVKPPRFEEEPHARGPRRF